MEEAITGPRENQNLEYGRTIKTLWERAGLTQQEFANLCGKGVSSSTLNAIKRGESLSDEAHQKIVNALNELALKKGGPPVNSDHLKNLWTKELKGRPGPKVPQANQETGVAESDGCRPVPRTRGQYVMWVALAFLLFFNVWQLMRAPSSESDEAEVSWPDLIPIPAGTFFMGRDGGTERNGPRTQMTITYEFSMSRCEITQAQFQALMGENPSRYVTPDRPVDSVDWRDAVRFCERLTELYRRRGMLKEGYVCRLPIEAEWEYACRAGGNHRFAGGDSVTNLVDQAWYKENSGGRTHPVGLKGANAWGLHDMHGNVSEWCADGASLRLPGGACTNHYVPPKEGLHARAYRGGSYHSHPGLVAISHRAWRDYTDSGLGFRVVMGPPLENLLTAESETAAARPED